MGDICDRFKRVRLDAGLRQGEYAEKLGEKLTRIKDIERGKQRPPAEVLGKVVEKFHVNGGWLLTGAGEIHKNCVNEEPADYGSDPVARLRYVTDRVIAIAAEREIKADPMQLGPLRDFAYSAKLSDEHIYSVFELLESAPKIYGYKDFNKDV